MINCWEEDVKIEPGVTNAAVGKYSFISLERATNDLINGEIDMRLVTAPINKDTIGESDQFNFPEPYRISSATGRGRRIVNVFGERYTKGWRGYRSYTAGKSSRKHYG